MLRLIQTEFLKLRRRRLVWAMLASALIMPFMALLYFQYFGKTGADPLLFYKWSAFSYSLWVILPVVLGILGTMLMHEETECDMLRQLWIVPVNKIGYFFSKFFITLIYSVCFMLITAVFSVLFSVLSGCVVFEWGSVLFLLKKCFEMGLVTAFVMMPVLAVAASQKGYIFPVCLTLVYTVLGFFLVTVNQYLHPLSSLSVILMQNNEIPGITFTRTPNLALAVLCICIWDIAAVLLAGFTLSRRK